MGQFMSEFTVTKFVRYGIRYKLMRHCKNYIKIKAGEMDQALKTTLTIKSHIKIFIFTNE